MNLEKTYAKLRIFPKIFWKSGPRFDRKSRAESLIGPSVSMATGWIP